MHWIACAIGGSTHDTVERAVRAQLAMSNHGNARLFGRRERLVPASAALVNGIASHVLDFDDTQLGATNVHPTGPVASALFALAEIRPLSGAALAHALVLGIEVECRLANAVFRHTNRGWHVTGAVGSLGAAAACAKALALEEQQIAFALGTAATQVVGLREMFGSMCKSLHTGRAADNGLTAAMLAAEGYTSADAAVEGPQGYAQVLNGATDLAGVVGALGQRYEISRLSYKPYACGVVMHPTIEACLRAREARPDLSARATAITLRVHPDVLSATGKQSPRTGLETKFSVYHAAAVALVHGIAGEDAFSDAMAVDPHVSAVRGRVRAQPDEAVRKDEVHATFSLPGETIEEHIDHVVGSVTRPMTDADLERKFESLAGEVLGASRCGRLLERCRGFEEISDAREVLAAATA